MIANREAAEENSDSEESGTDLGSDEGGEDILRPNPQPRYHFEVVVPKLTRKQKSEYRRIPGL